MGSLSAAPGGPPGDDDNNTIAGQLHLGRRLQTSSDFSCVDISSTISGDEKFASAAAASNGFVVFAPISVNCVGMYDAAARTFTCVDISIYSGEQGVIDTSQATATASTSDYDRVPATR